jgi:hypothetical protein
MIRACRLSCCSVRGRKQLKKAGYQSCWSYCYFILMIVVQGSGPPPIPSKPDTIRNLNSKKRQEELEQRHQELLARQKQLQVGRHPLILAMLLLYGKYGRKILLLFFLFVTVSLIVSVIKLRNSSNVCRACRKRTPATVN